MNLLQDTLSIFKKTELSFLESYQEAEDVYSFLFEKDNDLTWKAGQHGLFSITHKKIKNAIKPFSVASAPTENFLKITMKINDNPSDYKKAMLELKKGMKVSMSGPVGSFYIKDDSPTVLIAGGIGITPFRSIVKQIESQSSENKRPIHLLYMDSKKTFIYKDEFDEIANTTSLSVNYLDQRDDLVQEVDKLINLYKNNGKYYIAGPKAMVASISNHVKSKNISKRNIKKDAFFGY